MSITAVAYPVAVFAGLVYFRIPPRAFSLLLLVLAAGAFLTMTDSSSSGSRWKRLAQPLGLAGFALLVLASGSEGVLKLYPALVSGFLLTSFGLTLLRPPSMILRFAKLQDKSLEAKDNFPDVERYCRLVTLVWCAFFIVNICIAAYTGLFASSLAWSIYNGFISYILMGAIFFGEMVVRRFVIR